MWHLTSWNLSKSGSTSSSWHRAEFSEYAHFLTVANTRERRATTLAGWSRLTGRALDRFKAQRRKAAGIRSTSRSGGSAPSSGGGTGGAGSTVGVSSVGTTRVAEEVAGILKALHPDDLVVLIDVLEKRAQVRALAPGALVGGSLSRGLGSRSPRRTSGPLHHPFPIAPEPRRQLRGSRDAADDGYDLRGGIQHGFPLAEEILEHVRVSWFVLFDGVEEVVALVGDPVT